MLYNVHLYRVVKFRFDGVEAADPKEAVKACLWKNMNEASDVADCEGDYRDGAVVDINNAADFTGSVDFKQAAITKLLGA